MDGRNTEDLDLILSVQALQKLPEVRVPSQDHYFARGQFEQLTIDVFLTENPLFATIRSKYAADQNFLDRKIRLATVEGLLLLKLYALPSLYRQGNFSRVSIYEADIAALLQAYQPETEPLLAELSAFVAANDLQEIRTITTEILHRITRFSDRQPPG